MIKPPFWWEDFEAKTLEYCGDRCPWLQFSFEEKEERAAEISAERIAGLREEARALCANEGARAFGRDSVPDDMVVVFRAGATS